MRKKVVDWLLHFAGGALGTVLGAWLGSLAGSETAALVASVPVFLVFGFGREAFQHIDDTPMFNGHRVSEALAWGVGAAVAVVACLLAR